MGGSSDDWFDHYGPRKKDNLTVLRTWPYYKDFNYVTPSTIKPFEYTDSKRPEEAALVFGALGILALLLIVLVLCCYKRLEMRQPNVYICRRYIVAVGADTTEDQTNAAAGILNSKV